MITANLFRSRVLTVIAYNIYNNYVVSVGSSCTLWENLLDHPVIMLRLEVQYSLFGNRLRLCPGLGGSKGHSPQADSGPRHNFTHGRRRAFNNNYNIYAPDLLR